MIEEKFETNYDASQIQVLEGLEAVRKRPGMYIGNTSTRGLHHLVYEIVDNSIDEALAGYCDKIKVVIEENNSITVQDNGRGIPVDIHEKTGKPAVEVALTILHAGGKFGGTGYKVSGGLHGVGMSVVNALSEWLEVKVKRNGKIYQQKYEKGNPITELTVIGESSETGAELSFKPDGEIFEDLIFNREVLAQRLRELSFLNKGVAITLVDKRENTEYKYKHDGGIIDFIKYLNKNKDVLHSQPIFFATEKDSAQVEIALQYNDGYSENILSFANNIHTQEGGAHEAGFKAA
ncbi:MAG: ATP-binding protein, partial [Dehalobacterium sp.]